MKALKFFLSAILTIFFLNSVKSQIAGSFTVPNSFPTIAAAVNTLNMLGVAGPVTINVTAGHTETVAPGGLRLYQIAGASATSQVVFRRSGTGANPVLAAFGGGTNTANSFNQDGVWWLIGTSFTTIDGIDISDPNTFSNTPMEVGYGLVKASASVGCQYNTIKNCTITLNRNNCPSVSADRPSGSKGIFLSWGLENSVFSSAYPTSAAGTNSYNKFYGNTIQNCNVGISLGGIIGGTHEDVQNDIGGYSPSTGNSITNFGTTSALASSEGIRIYRQYEFNIRHNTINNNTGSGGNHSRDLVAIYLDGASNTPFHVRSNTITLNNFVATNYSMSAIYNRANTSAGFSSTCTISRNVFAAFNASTATNYSVTHRVINNMAAGTRIGIDSNYFSNMSATAPVTFQVIYGQNAYATSIKSNTISGFIGTGNGQAYGIYNVSQNGSYFAWNNIIENFSWTSTGTIRGIYGTANQSSSIKDNVIRNFSVSHYGNLWGIQEFTSNHSKTVTGNEVSNFFNSGGNGGTSFRGIDLIGTSMDVSYNTIRGFVASSTVSPGANSSVFTGIDVYSSSNAKISHNKVTGLNLINQSSGIVGMGIAGSSSTYSVYNNVIGDLGTTGFSGIEINALRVQGSPTLYLTYNSFHLLATSTNSNFAAAVVRHDAGGVWTARNNIFVNSCAASATGTHAVILRTYSSSNFTNYATASNNNLMYCDTPSANRVILKLSSGTYSSLPAFKSLVSPGDAQSVTENPPLITSPVTSSLFLSVNPSIPTQIEGGALPVSGYSVDYLGTARNTVTPDIGAFEGNYTQADIFPPVVQAYGFTDPYCNLSGRTLTVSLKDTSGIATGSVAPRLYYKINFGLYSSVQGSLTAGTSTNGVWTFSLSYSGSSSDVIYYFFAVQDDSPLKNLAVIPTATNTVANDINTIIIPPNPAYSYTLGNPPAISVQSGSICAGQSFTLSPTGATSYTFSSGSNVVTPSVTSSYSVVGSTTTGCASTVAIATVTVGQAPVISLNSGSICSGQTFSLFPSGAASYTFINGSQTVSPLITTSYSVTGSSSLGCQALTPGVAEVTVHTTPTISAQSAVICAGESHTFTPSGALTYSANGGSLVVNPTSNTSYTITGTGSGGCLASNSVAATVTVAPLPTIAINSGTLCAGRSFTLFPSGASTYTVTGGSFVVSPLLNSSYTVSGTSAFGCHAVNNAVSTVSVFSSPTIAVNSGSICSGNSFTIMPSGALSYSFSGGSAIVSPLSTSNFSTWGLSSEGCVSDAVVSTVLVHTTPTITANSGFLCTGEVYTIVPTGASSYTYSSGSATVSPGSTTNYSVTGISSAGCAASNTAVLTVSVVAPPTISVNSGSMCLGRGFTLTPSGALTYTYSGGSATVNPSVNTSYSVTGTSAEGCLATNTAVANVSILQTPTVVVTGGSICSGESFTFSPSGAISYTISGGSMVVSPGSTTSYSITGTNSVGCVSDPAVASLVVNTTPTITVNSGSICSGESFTVAPTGASSYTVSGGSSVVSPLVNSSYTVSGSGPGGCLSNQAVVSVSVYARPIVSVMNGSICAGQSFVLSPSGASSYSFSSGTATVNPNVTSSYSITGYSLEGCASATVAVATVSVETSPNITVSGPTVLCSGKILSLTATGANTYTWQSQFSGPTFTTMPASSSTYSVIGAAANGCTASILHQVTVNATPTLAIAGPTTICEGEDVNLIVSGSAASYTWSNNQQGSVLSATPVVTTPFTVTGTALNGCIATRTTVVVVYNLPPVKAQANRASICKGESVTLNGTGALTYTWSAGINNNVAFYPVSTNIYTVTGSSTNNCVKSATIQVQVHALPAVKISGVTDTLCAGETVTLTASGAITYTWYPDGSNIPANAVAPLITTQYSVVGVDVKGCAGTASVMVIVDECLGIGNIDLFGSAGIYPNPSSGRFTVEVKTFAGLKIIVRNALGELIYEDLISQNRQVLDLSSHARGVYIVEISDPGGRKSVRSLILQD